MNPKRRGAREAVATAGKSEMEEGSEVERLLDVREAATLLGVKPATLYQWAYQRRIPVVKLLGPRGALRIRLSDIRRIIRGSLRPALLGSLSRAGSHSEDRSTIAILDRGGDERSE